MTDSRWALVKEVFFEALALDKACREAFLAGRCAGDELLAEEVASLLRYHDAAGTFFAMRDGSSETEAKDARPASADPGKQG